MLAGRTGEDDMRLATARMAILSGIWCVHGCMLKDGGADTSASPALQPDPAASGASVEGNVDGQPLAGLSVGFIGGTFASGEEELSTLITNQTGVVPTRIHPIASAATLSSDDLAATDVLVLDNLARVYTEAEATLVADWVSAGHGLIAMAAFADDSSRVSNFAASYGVSYLPGLIDAASPGTQVTALAMPALTGGVSSLLVYGGFRLASTNVDAVAFAMSPPDALGLALTHGAGRVVIWGDDWILSDRELRRTDETGAQPTAVFWNNALHWVSQSD
jgi:hypothetical protein